MFKRYTIKLLPSPFNVDLYIYRKGAKEKKELKKLAKLMAKRYGWGYEYHHEFLEEAGRNWVSHYNSDKKSQLKGHTQIVCMVEPIHENIVHESYHILMRLNTLCNAEVNVESEEWGAMMIEYIYTEITKKAGL